MTEKENYERQAMAKLQKAIDGGEMVIFSAQEAASLKELASLWAQIKAVAYLGGRVGAGFKWLAIIVALWIGFRNGLIEWLTQVTKGGPT